MFSYTKLLLIFICVNALKFLNAKPVEVNEENWENLLSKGEWMVEFFAPWCPACNRFESTWNEFSNKAKELNIQVGAADVNSNPVLSGLFSVTSLPTIYHIKDGQYRIYNGNRELVNLVDFIQNKEWQKIEPSSSWLTPNSILIKGLSFLFKLTIYFKDIYTQLTEKNGYPMWAVLALFVAVTIAVGLLLGIFFIILIDFICPPKRSSADDLKDTSEYDVVDDKETTKDGQDNSTENSKQTDSTNKVSKRRAKKDN